MSNVDNKLFCDPNKAQLYKDTKSMKSLNSTFNNILFFLCGAAFVLLVQLFTGAGQDIPGTDGLTRYQVAKMLFDCDRGKYEGYCVADVNIRPHDLHEQMDGERI